MQNCRISQLVGLRLGVFGLGLLLVLMFPSLVRAAPTLSVSDLGQTAELSASPQPPLVLDPSGACSSPFTIESACPADSWPALGSEWGPTLYVAGGDTLNSRSANR